MMRRIRALLTAIAAGLETYVIESGADQLVSSDKFLFPSPFDEQINITGLPQQDISAIVASGEDDDDDYAGAADDS